MIEKKNSAKLTPLVLLVIKAPANSGWHSC